MRRGKIKVQSRNARGIHQIIHATCWRTDTIVSGDTVSGCEEAHYYSRVGHHRHCRDDNARRGSRSDADGGRTDGRSD